VSDITEAVVNWRNTRIWC